MSELTERIASLPPEKRELLKLLMAQEAAQAEPAPADAASGAHAEPMAEVIKNSQFSDYTYASSAEKKLQTRRLYNSVSQQLNTSPFAAHAFFLNFGYVPDHHPAFSQIELPTYALNKNCVRLVLEVIGDCRIEKHYETLDVGCGRGGTISVLNEFFRPKKMTGMDLSATAVAFCKRQHTYDNTYFLEGDAENLPFANASFDVVTNLESSHNYPDVFAFYQEVARVLRPNGYFLYTDLFSLSRLDQHIQSLQANGFIIEQDRDITSNVLLSSNEIGHTHFNAFYHGNDSEFMVNFLAVPGSKMYNDMRDGNTTYRIYKLRKALQ